MCNRNLNGLRINFFSEIDRALDGLLCLARKSDDEITVDSDADFFAILGKRARLLDGRAFLDVLQNLRIAGFKADDKKPGAGVGHRLECFVVAVDSRGARPPKT